MSPESFSSPIEEKPDGFLDTIPFGLLWTDTESGSGNIETKSKNNAKLIRAIEAGSADHELFELLVPNKPRNIHALKAITARIIVLIAEGRFDDKLTSCTEPKKDTPGQYMSILQAARARQEVLHGTR